MEVSWVQRQTIKDVVLASKEKLGPRSVEVDAIGYLVYLEEE